MTLIRNVVNRIGRNAHANLCFRMDTTKFGCNSPIHLSAVVRTAGKVANGGSKL